MKRLLVTVGGLAVLIAAVIPQLRAAQSSATPATVAVVLRFQTGKSTYHVGEEIPLELEFRGKADASYYFIGEPSRRGESDYETFMVTPANGAIDPLADYTRHIMDDGPQSTPPLDGTPLVVHEALNDWVRFVQPGRYRLIVTSTRLRRRLPAPPLLSPLSTPPLLTPIASAPVDLTITPNDDAWAASGLARAMPLVDDGVFEDMNRGVTLLRYLGTDAAIHAILQRYDAIATKLGAFTAEFVLLSLPQRPMIVKDMETRLDAGEAIDASFIPLLVLLSQKTLPNDPRTPYNRQFMEARTAFKLTEYGTRWLAATTHHPTDTSTLRAELALLAEQIPLYEMSNEFKQQLADDVSRHPAEAADAFAALPSGVQSWLLDEEWVYVHRPWIVPALRRVYDQWHGDYFSSSAGGEAALKRLLDVDPETGRRLMIEEIRTGQHGLRYEALANVPNPQQPELDDALRTRLTTPPADTSWTAQQGLSTGLWLAVRYGSPALRPLMTISGTDCTLAAPKLAFLLTNAPDVAARTLQTCATIPFQELSGKYWDALVEAAAIARLDNTDLRDASAAANALGFHGSAAVKAPLLDRLERWSAEWHERAAELISHRPSPGLDNVMNNISLERTLASALFINTRVALSPDDAVKIRSLCLEDGCRTNVDAYASGRRFK